MISDKDQIFILQTDCGYIPSYNKAYYGTSFPPINSLEGLPDYIAGYKLAVDKLFLTFVEAGQKNEIHIQDTIIYPLMFCHRHVVELELKYLASSYCSKNEEIKQVLQQGHDFIKIWNHICPHIKKRANRIGYNIAYEAIHHYLQEISNFDADSYNYRYSMKKDDLSPTITKHIDLDVPNMHQKLYDFHSYIFKITNALKNQCDYLEYNKTFTKDFIFEMKKFYNEINCVLNYQFEQKIPLANQNGLRPSEIRRYDPEKDDELLYCYNLQREVKRIMLILYFSKETIEHSNLAIDVNERRKDIFRILYTSSTNPILFDKEFSQYFFTKLRPIVENKDWYSKLIEELSTK